MVPYLPVTQQGPLFGIFAAVLIALGILSWAGRLPMNFAAGIRLPSLTKSEAAWQAGHRVAGPWFIAVGVVTAVFAVFLLVFGSQLEAQLDTRMLELAFTMAIVAAIVGAARMAVLAARAVSADDAKARHRR